MRNSSIWACSLQSNETAMMRWHPALITSSCSRALPGKPRGGALTSCPRRVPAQNTVTGPGRSPPLRPSWPTRPFLRTDGLLVGGPAYARLSQLLPCEVPCLNMSTVIGNSFFILKAETGVRYLQNPDHTPR